METTHFILLNILVIALSAFSMVKLQHKLKQSAMFFGDMKFELLGYAVSFFVMGIGIISLVMKLINVFLTYIN